MMVYVSIGEFLGGKYCAIVNFPFNSEFLDFFSVANFPCEYNEQRKNRSEPGVIVERCDVFLIISVFRMYDNR